MFGLYICDSRGWVLVCDYQHEGTAIAIGRALFKSGDWKVLPV